MLIGLMVLAACLVAILASQRYYVIPSSSGFTIKVDRWTGKTWKLTQDAWREVK